jgi:hypothetical protein
MWRSELWGDLTRLRESGVGLARRNATGKIKGQK